MSTRIQGPRAVESRRRRADDAEGLVEPGDGLRASRPALKSTLACSTCGLKATRRPVPVGDVAIGDAGLGRRRRRGEADRAQSLALEDPLPVADDDEEVAGRGRGDGGREHRDRDRGGDVRIALGEAHDDVGGHGMAEHGEPAVAETAGGRGDFRGRCDERAGRAVDRR